MMTLPNMTKGQTEVLMDGSDTEILALAFSNLEFWLKLAFPMVFTRPFSDKLKPLFYALDDRSLRQLVIIAFRGLGKTSIVQQGFVSREICFDEMGFLVTLSASNTLAVMQSESLKMQLMTNDVIRAYFGQIKPERREFEFSRDLWTTPQGNIVLPRGAGQQVRGMNYMNRRPSHLITDDAEDPKELKTEESLDAFRRWFFSDYVNIVDRGSSNWRHIVIGTRSITKTILDDLAHDPDWTHIDIPLCDDKAKSYHPFFMNDAQVLGLREAFARQGRLSAFYSEYMNQGQPPEDASFQQSMIKYYDPASIDLNRLGVAENILLIDIAKTVKTHSAHSAIVGVGIGVKENRFWVRDIDAGMFHPEEIYDKAFNMAIRLGARVICVEVTSLEDFIKHPFLDAMHARGLYFEFIWLKAVDKKKNRIRELVPYFRQGLISLNKSATFELEAQMLSFPDCKRFDILDALAYLPKALEEGERYFSYFGSENEQEPVEDFKDLEEEEKELEPLPANWRWEAA